MSVATRLLVWGAGGHGKVVADLARALGLRVVGYVDRDEAKRGLAADGSGAPVIASEGALIEALTSGAALPAHADCIAVGLGDNATRLQAVAAAAERCAGPLVHPAASVSPLTSLGRGTVVLPRAVINADARAGTGVIVNSGAVVEHDCVLADGVHVSPGAVLAGNVKVGALGWIGAGAVVLPGVRVGERTIVGAGAIVLNDVPEGVTVVGNPARIVKKRST